MQLLDYILSLDQNDKRIESWLENDCRCEVHEIDLEVGDGYEIINMDLSFDLDFEFLKLNPNCVIMYESLKPPKGGRFIEKKLIFCPNCEENQNKHSLGNSANK